MSDIPFGFDDFDKYTDEEKLDNLRRLKELALSEIDKQGMRGVDALLELSNWGAEFIDNVPKDVVNECTKKTDLACVGLLALSPLLRKAVVSGEAALDVMNQLIRMTEVLSMLAFLLGYEQGVKAREEDDSDFPD